MMKEYNIDLHNHTVWSDGENSAKEVVENAIKHNISILGISDHLQTSKCPSVGFEDINLYISEMHDIKLYYEKKIKLLVGIEITPYPFPQYFESIPFEKLEKLDYVLIENLDYMSSSISLIDLEKHLEKFKCRIGLAHTDLIKFSENHGGLAQVIEFLSKNKIFWEINSNSAYEFFDGIICDINDNKISMLLESIKFNNIQISVGSDTHDLADYEFGRLCEANKIANNFRCSSIE